MKPNFALNLTEDRIGLLQRTGKGWLPLGEVAFGAEDMEDRLTALREDAAYRAPRGIWTKLVIPNSQILYTTVTVTAATDVAKRDEIRAALVGRTPYAVEDLVFDWAGDGLDVQVAVVARETLEEAEGFAADRAFRPVSFVAIPDEGQFDGEPMFGPTAFSKTALGKGRRLERDLVPIRIIGSDTPETAAAEAGVPQETYEPQAADDAARTDDLPADSAADADVAAVSHETADVAAAMPVAEIFPESADVAQDQADAAVPESAAATVEPAVTDAPQPRFTISPVADPATSVVSATVPDMDDEAPFADVSDLVPDVPPGRGPQDDDLPPAPSTAALMAFASRRAAGDTPTAPARDTLRGSVTTTMPGLLADRLAARAQATGTLPPQPVSAREPARMAGGAAAVTAPAVPGGKKRKTATTAPIAAPEIPRKPLTKPGGTFATSQPVRGKPRFLGLILTGILILFLALVAAWSSFFLASRGDDATGTRLATAASEADAPLIDEEMLADGQVPADVAAGDPLDVPVAEPPGGAIEEVPVAAPDDPPAEPPAEEIAAPDTAGPAPETGVDVFGAAASGPAAVPVEAGDDAIFLSAADTPLVAPEIADLAAPAAGADALPAAQLPPPPFGTVYAFNPDGTIQGTPDGILTPEGVRLVGGPPQVRPPARPAAIAAAVPPVPETLPPAETAPAVTQPAIVGSDPALADARPRSRPANLAVPGPDDDAALATGGPVLARSPRPQGRPGSVLAAGEDARRETEAASLAAASAAAGSAAEAAILEVVAEPGAALATPSGSRLAVSVSRIPAPRPRDLERAVAAALAAATRAPEPEPEPEPEQAVAAAPEADEEPEVESVVSQAPTSGSVADRATYANAINLSRINLIGVYGTQSNRYALIRQGNGRYKKVTVGDRIDGGTIAAITANEVRYQKGGRLVALELPDT
jgi:hypothetical protein